MPEREFIQSPTPVCLVTVTRRSTARLDSDPVIYSSGEALGATQIFFGRLHSLCPSRNCIWSSSQQQNGKAVRRCGDYAACGIAPKVVGREVRYSRFCGEFLDDVPGKLLGDPVSPRLASAAHATENPSTVDSRSLGPRAELAIDPVWNRHRPDVIPLPLRSTIAQCPSRCWRLSMANSATSRRRSPHASRRDRSDRSRLPLSRSLSRAC